MAGTPGTLFLFYAPSQPSWPFAKSTHVLFFVRKVDGEGEGRGRAHKTEYIITMPMAILPPAAVDGESSPPAAMTPAGAPILT